MQGAMASLMRNRKPGKGLRRDIGMTLSCCSKQQAIAFFRFISLIC